MEFFFRNRSELDYTKRSIRFYSRRSDRGPCWIAIYVKISQISGPRVLGNEIDTIDYTYHNMWLYCTVPNIIPRTCYVFTAKRFLVPGQQVHFAAARRLVRMVSHVTALGLVFARETLAFQELLVRLARHGRERARRRHAVREELVRPPMVAQASAVHFGRRWNRKTSHARVGQTVGWMAVPRHRIRFLSLFPSPKRIRRSPYILPSSSTPQAEPLCPYSQSSLQLISFLLSELLRRIPFLEIHSEFHPTHRFKPSWRSRYRYSCFILVPFTWPPTL